VQGDVDPTVTITPAPNEDEEAKSIKEELENPESDARKEIESALQEEAQKKLEEKLGKEIDPENMDVEVHASEAFVLENVPLAKEKGLVIVPISVSYTEPGGESTILFFVMVMAYDTSTTPYTPKGYELVPLQESASEGSFRGVQFIASETDETVGNLIIEDQSEFDGDPNPGSVSVEYVVGYGDVTLQESPTSIPTSGGGGGCGLGLSIMPLAVLLGLPLMLLRK